MTAKLECGTSVAETGPNTVLPTPDVIRRLGLLFALRGANEYHGEAVTQLEHALQTAFAAEQNGASDELVAAALLHDVGHLLHGHGERAAATGGDDRHEHLGWLFLARRFGPAVSEPIRLHVTAKRYLCATEVDYLARLSAASLASLAAQGRLMSADERAAFEANPHARAAIALRQWDDAAKVPGLETPPLDHFLPYVEKARASAAAG